MKRNNEILKETPQANTELLEILNKSQNQEEDWENIKKCLKNGADPNLKYGFFQTPLIYFAIQCSRKDLFDYLLQLGADINATDTIGWTPLHVFILNRPINFCINDLLENKANTNAITIFCEHIPSTMSPLSLAITLKHFDFIKPLIQYKANVNYNKPNSKHLLKLAIDSENNDAIGQLCDAGASAINLDSHNHTAFHLAADKTKEIIKTFMTHIKFKTNEDNITKTIKTTLLVFNSKEFKFKIPHEIQIFILSKLLSPAFFHKDLYTTLLNMGHNHLPLEFVNGHIQHLQQILKIKNKDDKTALELAPKAHLYARKTETELLLDGSKIEEDLNIFNAKYPNIASIHPDNLALQIFKNHYA